MPHKLSKTQVKPILAVINHEGTTSRRHMLYARENYTVNNGDLIWQGGSKKEIFFLRQVCGAWEICNASDVMPSALHNPETCLFKIPRDVMIVEFWRMGQDQGYDYVTSPDSIFLPRMLP